MSKHAFETIEKVFGLPQGTIPVFNHQGGSHTYCFGYDGDVLRSLSMSSCCHARAHTDYIQGLVVKLPQLFQIGNWALSMRFSFSERATNALLWGWSVVHDREHLTSEQITPLYSEVENIVGESASAWNEPLFLPVVFLKLYIEHLVGFIQRDIARNASQLEGDFGVQSAHNWVDERHAKADAAAAASRMVDYMSDGPGRAEITSKLNTTSFNAICVVANIRWAQRYAQTLDGISTELNTVLPPTSKNKSDVQQTLQFLINKLSATQGYVDQIKARLDFAACYGRTWHFCPSWILLPEHD